MIPALISLILFLLLILIAIHIGLNRKSTSEEYVQPVLHTSGIYSIVRKSPREEISNHKPPSEEIRKYLEDLNENNKEAAFPVNELLKKWDESLNKNIETIEQGDKKGVEFYCYDSEPDDCSVCDQFFKKGQFVTREQIFQYPLIIPPFHIGCTSCLVPYTGKENLNDTTEIETYPLFKNELPPRLPEWRKIQNTNEFRGTIA